MASTVEAPPAPRRAAGPAGPSSAPWPALPPPQPPYADDPRFDGQEPAWRPAPPAPTPPPPARPDAVPAVRRARWWPALAVAVVLLLLAGSAYAVASRVGPSTDSAARRPTPTTTAPPTSSVPTTDAPSTPKSTTPSTTPGAQTDPGTGSGSTGNDPTTSSVDWEAVAAEIEPGMVYIETRVANGIGAGTGMILTADGTVLTNNHVIDGASSIVVTTAVDGKMYRATVVGADPSEDLAVIKLTNASGLTPIPLGDSSTVRVGDDVAGMGNAGGTGTSTVAPGTVLALDQQVTATDEQGGNAETIDGTIQVDANIVPGHSGGPLVSADAEVIGIDTAASANNLQGGSGGRSGRGGPSGSTASGSEGYAIPINHALDVAEELQATGKGADASTASGGYLGVQIIDGTAGAEVVGVATGGPAEQAGLTAGSVVTSIDGTAITSAQALSTAVQGHRSGDRVAVGWTDADGRSHQATITLG